MQNETTNPLQAYSLAGQGQSLADKTDAQTPLLGDICLKGELSVWYAPPNSGKTLIALALMTAAVSDKRLEPTAAFYVNADDTAPGLAEKTVILDDFGIHCLAPGHREFTNAALSPALQRMADEGTANGKLIVLDTFKKFADPMSKSDCRRFGDLLRQFCFAGGTVLALSHTNKSRGANGKLIYGGTSDLLEDADSAYLLELASIPAEPNLQRVDFNRTKSRGANAPRASYQYDARPELSYAQRLASVEQAEAEFGPAGPLTSPKSEQEIITTIENFIRFGTDKKMALVRKASKATKTSQRRIMEVLDRYTGSDLKHHFWDVKRGNEHNAYIYALNQASEPAELVQTPP